LHENFGCGIEEATLLMSHPEPLPSANLERATAIRQKFLVATAFMEPSETLDQTLNLAELAARSVVLLHVVEISRSELNPAVFASLEEIQARLDAYQRRARLRLESLGRAFRQAGIACTTSVRIGIPHEEILKEAELTGPDLIVVGAKATSVLGRFLLGGTAERVARHAPCPVLVVRQPRQETSP
jgi:nucleotide-binding universal stress UspA family protein